jgi:hypothetical protein
VFTNPIRAALVGAVVATRLIGGAGAAATRAQTVDRLAGAAGGLLPRSQPAPRISLDDLQVELRELATTGDSTGIRDGLGLVIAGLDAQAPLVSSPFEVTYLWLLGKLESLRSAAADKGDDDDVIHTVNTLAAELADALDS